jgi:acyl-CoA synthetase (AMP-forming)/AMP-acid ligase II
MTIAPRIPDVFAAGCSRSADEVEALAARWHAEIERLAGTSGRPIAVALPGDAEGVALFAAMSARPDWMILLPPDVRAWASLALPDTMTVLLTPSLAHATDTARRIAAGVHVLSDVDAFSRNEQTDGLSLLSAEGVVLFTSGSTGAPKPVFRPMGALTTAVRARLDGLGLQPGEGIVAGVALGHGHGLMRLLCAMQLGGPFGLLQPLDHRAALALLSQPRFGCWSASAHFADVLGRCRLTGPAVVPRICLLSSGVAPSVRDAFRRRFGVPLRQNYSSTETGIIAGDYGPPEEVDPETVGRPLPGVEIRIGEHPDAALPVRETGRIWVRSPWQMAGYGFPPRVERPGDVDRWWPTRDLGMMRADGRLVLAGRIDDCIRTREGRLVNLDAVAQSLRDLDGVREAIVLPIQGSAGASFGAVLACADALTLADLRTRVSGSLPEWAWPRALLQVAALPRLPGGKIDRRTCAEWLHGSTL